MVLVGGVGRVPVPAAAGRALADRGPRHHRRPRHRARGLDRGLHRPLRQADGGDLPRDALRRAVLHRDRLLGRDAGDQLRPSGRLGRSARSSSRTSRKSLFPKLFAIPGPARLRLEPALARPEPDRQAGPVRAADLAALRGAAGGGRPDDWRLPGRIPGCRISTPTSSSTSRSSRCRSTARRRRCWASTSRRSAARSRPCWAAGRSPASSATASSTTSIVQLKDVDRTNPDDLREIFVRGSDGQHGGALEPGADRGDGGAQGAQPLQQAALGDAHRDPGAGLLDGRGAGLPRRRGRQAAARDRHRPERPEPRVPQLHQRPLRHLPAGAGLHLSGAGGPVRELDRPGDHHADRAAVDDGRACSPSSSPARA